MPRGRGRGSASWRGRGRGGAAGTQRGGKAGGARQGAAGSSNSEEIRKVYQNTAVGQALRETLAKFREKILAVGDDEASMISKQDVQAWNLLEQSILESFTTSFVQMFKESTLQRSLELKGQSQYRNVDEAWQFIVKNPSIEGGDFVVHSPVVVVKASNAQKVGILHPPEPNPPPQAPGPASGFADDELY